MLREIHRSLDFSSIHDRVLWGATVMGFFYLLRRSEYLAQGKRVQHYAISRADTEITNHANALLWLNKPLSPFEEAKPISSVKEHQGRWGAQGPLGCAQFKRCGSWSNIMNQSELMLTHHFAKSPQITFYK
ncbi:hypothetical protein PHMEG_00023783 [Phytophthora megakarya]|uniref:Uncharacterized protein n=1 Tax=Phytophthora megakarya TaxID=4795 RepID=A0A225VG95_9STRA|nr:hypothetical protein PHMEG_00023783 [Phytophthora megakarya]